MGFHNSGEQGSHGAYEVFFFNSVFPDQHNEADPWSPRRTGSRSGQSARVTAPGHPPTGASGFPPAAACATISRSGSAMTHTSVATPTGSATVSGHAPRAPRAALSSASLARRTAARRSPGLPRRPARRGGHAPASYLLTGA